MIALAVHKRNYHTFLSHSSRDKEAIVDNIYRWFTDFAGIPVWYDRTAINAGSQFVSFIADSIPKCRSMIIVLSQSAVQSGWVEEEINHALAHQKRFPNFRVIPVVIDDCQVPTALTSRSHYRLDAPEPTLEFYNALLQALYYDDIEVQYETSKDVFVSRTWRSSEAPVADRICRQFMQAGFRLIGDAEDQPNFSDSKTRVKNIIASCGALLAVLPYRADKPETGCTSQYMLDEIEIARFQGRPYAIFAEPGVALPDAIQQSAMTVARSDDRDSLSRDILVTPIVEQLREQWIRPVHQHYVFFATNFDEPKRNEMIRRAIQRVTAMKCILGEEVRGTARSVQEELIEKICNAFLVIGDISADNINTLIEMGAARAAKVPYRMVAAAPRRRPPFMFRDVQVDHYENDAQLLGIMHKLVYPYRRRVLNFEL